MKKLLLVCAVFLSCGKPAPSAIEPVDPPADVEQKFWEAVKRFDDIVEDEGWTVSRDSAGAPQDVGDSLIFSGVAMHALPCEHPSPLFRAFPDGELYRHPSLRGEPASLDGALGYMFGVAAKITRCGQSAVWQEPAGKVVEWLSDAGDSLLPKEFGYVKDALAHFLGRRGSPSPDRKAFLEAEVASWAQATVSSKSACYRVHLGWLTLRTLEMLDDGPSDAGKNAFCAAASGAEIPVIENWCGRKNLLEWLNSYQSDVWAYRHQRCAGWEQPDGHGWRQPGVDYLLGLREAFKLK